MTAPPTREVKRAMKCCGGPVYTDGNSAHAPDCPNIVRCALSWIEDTSIGERHRKRGLDAFELIVAGRTAAERDRDRLAARVRTLEAEREIGATPHFCRNNDCGTIAYGVGYKACPTCGDTTGRAVLAEDREQA